MEYVVQADIGRDVAALCVELASADESYADSDGCKCARLPPNLCQTFITLSEP